MQSAAAAFHEREFLHRDGRVQGPLIKGGPQKTETVDTVNFFSTLLWSTVFFFHLAG